MEGADGPLSGRAVQRRRLALLALLAMGRRQGHAREKLATMLWPESEGDRARHLLSDSIYVINRELGEAIAAAGDELRLRSDVLTCDARGFEDAAERGDAEEAVRLYAGPFLDGFFLDGNEDFERWSAAERQRLQDLYSRTLERLAERRTEAGDLRGAVECWRRLAAEDPLNSRVACALAGALDRAGDRAGALQQMQSHVATLKQELGIAPPPEVSALVRELRAAPPAGDAGRPPEVRLEAAPPAAVTSPAASPAPIDAPAAVAPSSERPRRGPWLAAAATLVAVIVALVGLRVLRPKSDPSVTAASLQSVAVLPFADLSPGRDQEYLSDGISEELSTRLARVPGLKVAARTSAFAFKGTGTDVRAIGQRLNVDAVLEGSVRQAEGRVRIAARLVDARAGYQIWADTWDRSGRDVFALQDEIATGVLRALRGPASAMTESRPPRAVDPSAYDLYLQGRYFWHQRTRDGLTRAAAAFDRAVAIQPDYAEALSGVADAYAVLGFYDHLPPRDAFPRAKAAAERALALDPALAEAHASLGYVALYYDWDWAVAERSLRRAIELNPSYSIGHQWMANFLVARGRFDEAVAAAQRAQEVDPLSLIASAALGWVHYYARDFDAAVQQCRRTIELNSGLEQAWLWGGWAHEAAGRHAEARQMLQQAATLSRRSAPTLAALGRAHAVAGDAAAARRILAELERDHSQYLPAYEMAKLHLALGEPDRAMSWLRRAFDQRSHSIAFLGVDPQLDGLRADAGFRDLLARTGAP